MKTKYTRFFEGFLLGLALVIFLAFAAMSLWDLYLYIHHHFFTH